MLRGIFETLAAVYEVSTVVTDVVLNAEYIKRNWLEEYILSIVFLVASGFVLGFVGLGLESALPNRYSRVAALNKAAGFLIGLLQLRVLVETAYATAAHTQAARPEYPHLLAEDGSGDASSANAATTTNTNTTTTNTAEQTAREAKEARVKQLGLGLLYAAFVQAIVRDMPIFVLQANATIHYRKWEALDIIAVVLTALSLVRGVAAYVGKQDKGFFVSLLTLVFLFGQFVFRLGVILLVAMTKGYVIVGYGLAITYFAIASTAVLRLAHPSDSLLAQLPRALIFFPLYTFFILDGSVLSARFGSALPALRGSKLLYVHAWRFLENCIGVLLAVTMPRYTDFGTCSDTLIVTIGAICAGVYLVSFALFWPVIPHLVKTSDEEKTSEDAQISA